MSPRSTVTSDTGPFAMVPLWLLECDISPQAIRLYAILAAKYADQTHVAFPSRARLADDLRISIKTVDRAIQELVEVKGLTVTAAWDEAGDRTSNRYTVLRMSPGSPTSVPTGSPVDVPTGSPTSVPLTRTIVNQTQIEPPPPSDPLLVLFVDQYSKEINTSITPSIREKMLAWCEEQPPPNEACLRYAFSQAAGHNGRSWSYVDGILRRLQAKGWPAAPASMSDRKPATAPVVATAHRI